MTKLPQTDMSPEAQGIHGPTPEDIDSARNPRDTLWKRLTSSTAARALIVAVAGLGAITAVGNLAQPGNPEIGSYDYAVTQVENGTRYTREHVTGVYKDGMFTAKVQKHVQTIEVSTDRADVSLSVGVKNETYRAGSKIAEENLGSRFIQPGAVSMGDVGSQTAGLYRDANALNNHIYDVKGAEAALQRVPEIEAKREKNAETVRIIEQEQGGIENAWARLVKYNQLADTAQKSGMAAFFLEHGKVMSQQDMDMIIKAGDSMGWRAPSGETVPMKDAVSVLVEKGTFTAIDGKEFSYTSQADLFRQVSQHYRVSADALAPHVHKYSGADGKGGIPGPVSQEKVEAAKQTVSDFTHDYGSYEQAGAKLHGLFDQATIRLSETFAQKAQRPPAPQQEVYSSFNLTLAEHQKIESGGSSIALMLPQSHPTQVTVTVTPPSFNGK